MSPTAKKVLDAALKLPEAEKVRVAEGLLAVLDGGRDKEVDAAWAREIERRTRDMEQGRVTPVPWSKVKKLASRRVRAKN